MPDIIVQLAEFARWIGELGAAQQRSAEPFHREFVGATPERQGEMRDQWVLGHLTGQFVTPKLHGRDSKATAAEKKADMARAEALAEKVMGLSRPGSAGKCRSAAQQAAYDRARADFRYHVMKPKTSKKAEPVKAPRISREERAAWAAFVAIVGERAAVIAKTLG